MRSLLRWCLFLVCSLALGSCAEHVSQPALADAAAARGRYSAGAETSNFAEPPKDRPGLGTKWGESRSSIITAAAFDRADPARPLATAEIFYNDRAGIEAMAAAIELRRVWPALAGPAASLVSIGLRDQSGRFLPGAIVGDRWFVVGEEGRRYAIAVRNNSDFRFEVVLSVDGLDVLDGRPASVRKRGYVIPPHRILVVEGFRQSSEAVAAFRFSSVRESYAHEKYGNTRSVGVIGLAIFNERGTFPWSDREIKKRLHANPFPAGFASPP